MSTPVYDRVSDRDLDAAERVLAVHLSNQATYTRWVAEVVKAMPPKVDKRTGELKPGISESKFRGLRKVLLERGRVVQVTSGEGGIYSVVRAPGGTTVSGGDAVPQTAAKLPQPSSPSDDGLVAQAMRHAWLRGRLG